VSWNLIGKWKKEKKKNAKREEEEEEEEEEEADFYTFQKSISRNGYSVIFLDNPAPSVASGSVSLQK
jgi:basic membrane lipoprotein Med (substrate-binding protein (PBP1-ABC) superfamily)